jgi:LPXTG-motif cell wall-anchored protein
VIVDGDFGRRRIDRAPSDRHGVRAKITKTGFGDLWLLALALLLAGGAVVVLPRLIRRRPS